MDKLTNADNKMEKLVLDKTRPIFLRYQEIDKLLTAPEVMADTKWYQRLVFEQKKIEEIAKGYEELHINKILIDECEEKNQIDDEEITVLKNNNKDLVMNLLSLTAFSGKEEDNGAIIKLKSDNSIKNIVLDIEKMYINLSKMNKWQAKSKVKSNQNIFEVEINILGHNIYSYLNNETGIFQIIDEKGEKYNLEVLVLPIKKGIDIEINNKEIKIEVSHASGAGGQNVNKVATAIRAVHLPTNTAVSCQDERSQYANKEKAIKRLKEKVRKIYNDNYNKSYEKQKIACINKLQEIGQIRKIDYKNNFVYDNRSGLKFVLDEFLLGKVDDVIKLSLL